ncbi:MAG TPA: ABC transporter substrate binding protein [Anaerolineae bacterium]|nr:ABC transporter substrate binding protein [Anaerolineae bacterium]
MTAQFKAKKDQGKAAVNHRPLRIWGHKRPYSAALLLLLAGLILAACNSATSAPTPNTAPAAGQTPAASSTYAGKKILFIDAYHEGYAWSDGIITGVNSVLNTTGIDLKIVHMDTKRNPSEDFAKTAGQQVKAEIDAFKPDVVIASDDNAQKYVIVPFYKGTNLPVVFDGVNWDASTYGYTGTNVTGMVEVELPGQLIDQLKPYAKGTRLGYLTVDSETERKVVDTYNQRFFNGQMKTYWVKTLDDFKKAYLQAQNEVDILFMGNNAGSDRWDQAEMEKFILDNTKIPSGSINDWMAPYSLVTLAKVPAEQGEWAAKTALRILDGTRPADIPFAENKKGKLILNLPLAEKLNVVFAPSMLKNADVYPPKQ